MTPTRVAMLIVLAAIALTASFSRDPQGSASAAYAQQAQPVQHDDPAAPAVRFDSVDVFIDSRGKPMGAYQFELSAKRGQVKIVGLEGNGSLPFADPPYHDPKAMQRDRVIVAAYSMAEEAKLPTGRVRVATVHVQVEGQPAPEFDVKLHVAGNAAGDEIPADISFTQGTAS